MPGEVSEFSQHLAELLRYLEFSKCISLFARFSCLPFQTVKNTFRRITLLINLVMNNVVFCVLRAQFCRNPFPGAVRGSCCTESFVFVARLHFAKFFTAATLIISRRFVCWLMFKHEILYFHIFLIRKM